MCASEASVKNNTYEKLVLVPVVVLEEITNRLSSIEKLLRERTPVISGKVDKNASVQYIRAQTFMDAVGIKRTKFSDLVRENKIKTIKKSRHVYVLASEVQRYFSDPSIQ